MKFFIQAALIYSLVLTLTSCGGGGSTPVQQQSGINIVPTTASVPLNGTQAFNAFLNSAGTAAIQQANWSVNSIAGGNSTVGTISASGVYTAPASFPSPNSVTITAALQSNTSQTANAAVTVIFPNDNSKAQAIPVKLGASGGNSTDKVSSGSTVTCCSGTLGALVTRNGSFFILSNNHVLDKSDTGANGDPITQPGLVDNNCNGGALVANLTQPAPLKPTANTTTGACAGSGILCGPAPSNVDAAIAQIVPATVDTTGAILDLAPNPGSTSIGAAPPSSTLAVPSAVLAANTRVAKSGRSTGLTCSTLQSINTTVTVTYTATCGGPNSFTAVFSNQLMINGGTFSATGDSGSLVVTADAARPLGLLYGGNSTSTSANPIGDVLAAFQSGPNSATIVGGGDHAVSCSAEAGAGPTSAGPSAAQLTVEQKQRLSVVQQKYAPVLMRDSAIREIETGVSADNPKEGALVLHVSATPSQPVPAQIEGVRTRVIYEGVQPRGLGISDIERAAQVKDMHVDDLMAQPGVQGVGVGRSDDNPQETALVIYVEDGTQTQLPQVVDGQRTKIVTGDRFRAFGWGRETLAPTSCKKPAKK
jgi:hypothetical protein